MKGFTSTPNDTAGSFDRTIFLKINMQLSTATMRSSLDSDWKMLTQESKDLLIGSSMRPRPADPIFLEIAKSPDNPNRCTCAQIAPKEYNADPTCCARGTELVFTWRKNGDLEVRVFYTGREDVIQIKSIYCRLFCYYVLQLLIHLPIYFRLRCV